MTDDKSGVVQEMQQQSNPQNGELLDIQAQVRRLVPERDKAFFGMWFQTGEGKDDESGLEFRFGNHAGTGGTMVVFKGGADYLLDLTPFLEECVRLEKERLAK